MCLPVCFHSQGTMDRPTNRSNGQIGQIGQIGQMEECLGQV